MSLIVAVSSNGVIGRGNELPWHLPADLARFKRLTMGHHLIVGRRTWMSIARPLPGRRMVVVSRSRPELPDGVAVARSLDRALDLARAAGDDEAFVAGGATLYARALPTADRIYWTEIHDEVDGDVKFPEWDPSAWTIASREPGKVDAANRLGHTFFIYDRLKN